MSKMRIYELAKQLGVANKELMEKMKSVGMEANSHMRKATRTRSESCISLHRKRKSPKKKLPSRK